MFEITEVECSITETKMTLSVNGMVWYGDLEIVVIA
jgi:hypothetical protein